MSFSVEKAVILSWEPSKCSATSAKKLAEYLGAEAVVISVGHVQNVASLRETVPVCPALIVDLETLGALAEVLKNGEQELVALFDFSAHLFVYGNGASLRTDSILRILSLNRLRGLKPLEGTNRAFSVSANFREFCGAFSGLTFSAVDRAIDFGFAEGEGAERLSILVHAENRPFFVRVVHGSCEVFLVACSEFGELDQEVSSKVGLLPWFSRVVPLMIFLRRVFGQQLWHGDNPRACFIIDDPLLKRRYGFLDYSQFLKTVEGQKFCASIAFIPWNYRRSDKATAKIFTSEPTPLSLCIHGCDHTHGEFAATNQELLRDKARVALDRMGIHAKLSGLPFDDVMVFPQGLFSSDAMKALESCDYLAAVNTTLQPRDMQAKLTLRELLDLAMTKFGGVPLFVRHYPREIAEFAFDLFLGKPAFVVEHHGYFRDGYEPFGAFIQQMNGLDERMEWRNLEAICSRTCLKKVMPNGDVQVRFYANRFRLTNDSSQARTYILQKQVAAEGPLPNVAIDGRSAGGDFKEGTLTIVVVLEAGKSAEIRIKSECHDKDARQTWEPTSEYKMKVFVRRMLSEFRDNHVETNGILRKLLANIRGMRSKGSREVSGISEYAN